MPSKGKRDRYAGCLTGLAMGDAMCAPYEGGIPERLLWKMIGHTKGRRRYTDDTQMSMDLCRSLLACNGVDQDQPGCFRAQYLLSFDGSPAEGIMNVPEGRGPYP